MNFKPTSTRYFVFAAAWTYDPHPLALQLTRLRFSLTKPGFDLNRFHASDDQQRNRDAVVKVLTTYDSWKFAAIVVDKRKVAPNFRSPKRFYPKYAIGVLRFVLGWNVEDGTTTALVYTDRLPRDMRKEPVEKAIKIACRNCLSTSTSFHVYHHPSESNCWLQVADYCAWASQRKWERHDTRTYDSLKPRLAATELAPMRYRTHNYY